MSKSRCKVEIPNQLPASGLTRVQFKSWKEAMIVYLKQNEDYGYFFSGGLYEEWTKAEDFNDRIKSLHNGDSSKDDTEAIQSARLSKRRTDLHTMLNIIGGKVDQYDYDDVLNASTSLNDVWTMLEQTYDIGRKGIQFLELQAITYDKKESPLKFYKRVYHLVMDNLYRKGELFNNVAVTENEKLSPTFLNFIMYFVLEKIDSRLIKQIKEKWGHILDSNKSLHEMKDIIFKSIPDILMKLEQDIELSAFNNEGLRKQKGHNRGFGNPANRRNNKFPGKSFCRLCQTAGEPRRLFTSHNMSNCKRWTRKDVEELRYMMCELEIDPNDFEDSDTDE